MKVILDHCAPILVVQNPSETGSVKTQCIHWIFKFANIAIGLCYLQFDSTPIAVTRIFDSFLRVSTSVSK